MRLMTGIILFAAALPALAQATSPAPKTILHVPFFVEVTGGVQPNPTYTYVPVAEINKTLIAKGLPAQTDSVDLTIDSKFDSFAANDKLSEALEKAGLPGQPMGELVPGSYNKGAIQTCYKGDGNGVVDIVLNNRDNLYSDQFMLIGWKFGAKTVFSDNVDDTTDKEFLANLNSESKLWKFYRKTSDAVVILASVGDGGDDVQESYIPRCK